MWMSAPIERYRRQLLAAFIRDMPTPDCAGTAGLIYFFQAAADGRRSCLGDAHQLTLASLHTLGEAHWRAGALPRAEAVLNEALSRRERTLGSCDPRLSRIFIPGTGAFIVQKRVREKDRSLVPGGMRVSEKDTLGETGRGGRTRSSAAGTATASAGPAPACTPARLPAATAPACAATVPACASACPHKHWCQERLQERLQECKHEQSCAGFGERARAPHPQLPQQLPA